MYASIYAWYLNAVNTQRFPGPYYNPLRFFGIVAFALMLVVAAYTLRRRFARRLPWKVQDWLWLHIWFGILSLLLSLLTFRLKEPNRTLERTTARFGMDERCYLF